MENIPSNEAKTFIMSRHPSGKLDPQFSLKVISNSSIRLSRCLAVPSLPGIWRIGVGKAHGVEGKTSML